MRWQKLGRLYTPSSRHPKLASHAANPLAIQLEGDVYRVFFSGRDQSNRSSVGFVDVDLHRRSVVREHESPVFEHGLPGSFYSHGVSIGCHYRVGTSRSILFMGWQVPPDGHWRGDIGRLTLADDLETLSLEDEHPFLGADEEDRLSLSYPWIERQPNGDFRMWYGSTESWDAGNGEMLHPIKLATSDDGVAWRRLGVAVPYRLGEAQAFSRPTLARRPDGSYDMWFSYRGNAQRRYRIGYAFSQDGIRWSLRLGETGIDVSEAGWDSEMIEYPYVFDHGSERYMLYNGNGYGASGFGLAVLDQR